MDSINNNVLSYSYRQFSDGVGLADDARWKEYTSSVKHIESKKESRLSKGISLAYRSIKTVPGVLITVGAVIVGGFIAAGVLWAMAVGAVPVSLAIGVVLLGTAVGGVTPFTILSLYHAITGQSACSGNQTRTAPAIKSAQTREMDTAQQRAVDCFMEPLKNAH